jgi:hypothetical protein
MIIAASTPFVVFEFRNPLNGVAFRLLETDCRAAQAISFAAVILAICCQDVQIRRNFMAICPSYGLHILVGLISLVLLSQARTSFSAVSVNLQAARLDTATAIWLVSLWNADRRGAMLSEQEWISEGQAMHFGLRYGSSKPKRDLKAELA